MLALLTGVGMLALGIARLGSLVRFVPSSVLVGFVNAVAINIILSQVDEVTGYQSDAANRVLKALDTVVHPGQIQWAERRSSQRSRSGSSCCSSAPGSGRWGWSSPSPWRRRCRWCWTPWAPRCWPCRCCRTSSRCPGACRGSSCPSLGLVVAMVVPALSLVFVGLVQGAAIGGTMTKPDGSANDASGDFRGQGIANLATGVLQGTPVAGSMSATNLVRAAGGRTATANLFAGVVIGASMLLLSRRRGLHRHARAGRPADAHRLAQPQGRPAGAHLAHRAGAGHDHGDDLRADPDHPAAVRGARRRGAGRAAARGTPVEPGRRRSTGSSTTTTASRPRPTRPPRCPLGRSSCSPPTAASSSPRRRPSRRSCRGRSAPDTHGVVVLRLRAKDELGSTVVKVLIRYAEQLAACDARLMLCGRHPRGPAAARRHRARGPARRATPSSWPTPGWACRCTRRSRAPQRWIAQCERGGPAGRALSGSAAASPSLGCSRWCAGAATATLSTAAPRHVADQPDPGRSNS